MADPDREQPDDPPWLKVAFKEFRDNVMEKAGPGDNPRIVKYLKTTNIGRQDAENDETAWCSAFINFCIEEGGLTGTKNALARSWLDFGKKIDKPVRGCIAVFERGGSGSSQGHVGFYLSGAAPQINILSGNTGPNSNAVTVAVHSKPLLGFRLPEGGLSMADVKDILEAIDSRFRLTVEGDATHLDNLSSIRFHVVKLKEAVDALAKDVKNLKDAHSPT
jgi:uncharacterized protein (TIGR02594 family)